MENERRVIELIRKSSNQDEAIKVALEILTMLLEARGILKIRYNKLRKLNMAKK